MARKPRTPKAPEMENLDVTGAPLIAPTFESTDEALDHFVTPPDAPEVTVEAVPEVEPTVSVVPHIRVIDGMVIETF